jgi:hypothetical protein
MKTDPPRDSREYVRIAVDLPMNPKLAILDDPAAGWLHVAAICYCGANFTDGIFPVVTVVRMAGVPLAKVDRLAGARLWHLSGHDCVVCPQPEAGYAVVHDYLEHQRSAADAKSLREARRAAGQKGAAARWPDGKGHSKSMAKPMASAIAPAMANGEQVLWQNDGKSMAEVEVEEEQEIKKKTSSSSSPRKRGTRIPDDFAVTSDMVAWAKENAPAVDGRVETENFRDYWVAKSGTTATKLDWVATWRTWMRNAQQRTGARNGLRVVGGYQPFQNPADQSAYDAPI